MTFVGRPTFKLDTATLFPDNTTGEISPLDLRIQMDKIADVTVFKTVTTFNPTATDDSAGTAGNGEFNVGDIWINETSGFSYICLDDTAGAATWSVVGSDLVLTAQTGSNTLGQVAVWANATELRGGNQFIWDAGVLSVDGDISLTGTVNSRDLSADGSKLDSIESNATADQTGAEIVAAIDTELNSTQWKSSFLPTDVTGTLQALNVGDYNFFRGGTIVSNTALAFNGFKPESKWTWTATIGGNYDISAATREFKGLNAATSISVSPALINSIVFNRTGTKCLVLEQQNAKVHQFTVSSAWDLQTATYDGVYLDVSTQDNTPRGIALGNNDTRLYVVGSSTDAVFQYTLPLAGDASSASFNGINFNISAQDNEPRDIVFRNDGRRMYILGGSNDSVYQYNLASPWVLSSAAFASKMVDISAQDTDPSGIVFNNTGTRMLMSGRDTNQVYQYTLSIPWDIATASYDSLSLNTSTLGNNLNGIAQSANDAKVYAIESDSNRVHQYVSNVYASITLPNTVSNGGTINLNHNMIVGFGKEVFLDFYTVDSGTTVRLMDYRIQ